MFRFLKSNLKLNKKKLKKLEKENKKPTFLTNIL